MSDADRFDRLLGAMVQGEAPSAQRKQGQPEKPKDAPPQKR